MNDIRKIIETTARPSDHLRELSRSGLLGRMFPELAALDYVLTDQSTGASHKNIYYHTLQVLDNIAATTGDPVLRWAAVLHDIGKPGTQGFDGGWTFYNHNVLGSKMVPGIMSAQGCPDEWKKPVGSLVYYHMRPVILIKEPVTDSAVRRYLTDTTEYSEALLVLAEADITSRHREKYLGNIVKVREMIDRVKARDAWDLCSPVYNGNWIMDHIDLRDPSDIGTIKDYLKEKILSGGIPNDHDHLRPYLEEILKETGLQWKSVSTGQ